MNYPKVSILTPVYGVEKYIRRCAESLMSQTYENLEYIIVNDCTKDASVEILKEVIAEYPKRKEKVKLIELPDNKGLANARNVAIDAATGVFVLIVDSDDWVEPDIVEELVKYQQETEADIVSSNTFCHHSGKVVVGNTYESLKSDPLINVITHNAAFNIWGRLIRKSLYTDNGIYCKIGINQGEDLQTFPKLAYYANKHVCVNRALYHYNAENQSSYTYKNRYRLTDIQQQYESFCIFYDFFKEKNGGQFRNILGSSKADFLYYLMRLCCSGNFPNEFQRFKKMLLELEITDPSTKKNDLAHILRKSYWVTKLVLKLRK